MYRYNPACGLEPLPGLPLEASDADFKKAVEAYEAEREGAKGSVAKSGIYEHVEDKKAASAAEEG